MKSFGSQVKNTSKLSRASIGSRLILLVPIKLRVLVLTPVACSITSYVQGLPVCRSLRAISSFNANFTAIPPNVSLLSFYSKLSLCQIYSRLTGNYLFYCLTYWVNRSTIQLSTQISRAAQLLRTIGTALASDKGRYPMSSANSNSTDSPENGQFNAPLSSQLDEALAWVEHYRDQLAQDRKQLVSDQEALLFWLKTLEELQRQLPTQNPFKEFINSLD